MDNGLEEFDVCIIGGSLAGNYLCYLISKLNLKIAVIEEHHQIGFPLQCAGIVSKKIKRLISIPSNLILNQVKIAKLVSPTGKYILLSGDEQPLVIDRIGLDQYFYDLVAQMPNVTYYMGEKFKSFSYLKQDGQKKISIISSTRKIITNLLVGCDGPLSTVAKGLKLRNEIIYASQITIKGTFDANQAVMYFNPLWKELFGWIVPESKEAYRIGLATASDVSNKLKKFLKLLHLDYETRISQQGGIIPYGLMKKIAHDHIILLGDAACQVKATTGGGIIMLLTAAKIAALAIRKSFKAKNFSKSFYKRSYEKPCQRIVGLELRIHYLIRLLLTHLSLKDYEVVFSLLKIRHIEQKISLYGDMDFPRSLVIQLLRSSKLLKFLISFFLRNPRLILKVLRTILYK